jgi:multiple sugar transport system permease protein
MHRGALATLAILTSISAWNEFFWPFIVGRSPAVQTMSVAMNTFRTHQPEGAPDWPGLMACAILGILPLLLLLIVLGRRVVESLQHSGAR